jgi:hypothetical protein
MWIRELATGWERVYKPSEHASASVTRGTRDAVPTERARPSRKGRLQKLLDRKLDKIIEYYSKK